MSPTLRNSFWKNWHQVNKELFWLVFIFSTHINFFKQIKYNIFILYKENIFNVFHGSGQQKHQKVSVTGRTVSMSNLKIAVRRRWSRVICPPSYSIHTQCLIPQIPISLVLTGEGTLKLWWWWTESLLDRARSACKTKRSSGCSMCVPSLSSFCGTSSVPARCSWTNTFWQHLKVIQHF